MDIKLICMAFAAIMMILGGVVYGAQLIIEEKQDEREEREAALQNMKPFEELDDGEKSRISDVKLAAGISAIFFGTFGVHKFVLGFHKEGIIMLIALFTVIGGFIMSFVALLEGLKYIFCSQEDFYQNYVILKKKWL